MSPDHTATSAHGGTETRIGLYGGTFDPVHNGHLILAREAREQLGLDRVVFIPAAVSPHKMERPPSPASARLDMLLAAIDGEPGFEVDDCELLREGVSFTFDTASAMRARFPNALLFYFVGDDNMALLKTWHRFSELCDIVRFVVLARRQTGEACPYSVIRRRVDISSTDIRNRVARGLSIRYLVPETLCELIARRRLYVDE